jgi:hypothetical protein
MLIADGGLPEVLCSKRKEHRRRSDTLDDYIFTTLHSSLTRTLEG